MIRRGCQCVTLSLTSRMQRLCVESWTVGLLYRCWEQLLLSKETHRCGHKRFSAEEMNLRFTSVQHHHHTKTTVLMSSILVYDVLVGVKNAKSSIMFFLYYSLLTFSISFCASYIHRHNKCETGKWYQSLCW